MAEHNEIEMAEDHVEMVDHSKIIENKAIPMQILRDATSNFGVENLLGEGGFGSVYRGTLQDGREIAVKKMNQSAIAGKGLKEFKSEVAVLNQENDRLLVYQYMPQGTLSKHLFHWGDHSLRPLDWTTRLSIALDVARAVEYLHTLALQNQSYTHRDLKPPNILLGDDLRAKASDFGLVTATEEDGESVKTKCRGTPGYMAPEYCIMLREDDTFLEAIDGNIIANQETQRTIYEVAKLARQCCTRTPEQRPEKAQVVSFLSSLIERWEPSSEIQDFDENIVSSNLIAGWKKIVKGSSNMV
uniref:Protein kinase domain-containing protein n=1 Tax=Brassica oleracea TaxID=3712 RepID=A0A3P6GC07_BRAOL|nr:unnamed protein product [Brassica oleracea]